MESLQQLPGILTDLQKYSEYTSLYLNLSKMVVYDKSCEEDYQLHGVTVTGQPVKYLGTFVGASDKPADLNLSQSIQKMKHTAQKWKHHSMTLYARVLIFKTMIFSQIVHTLNTSFVPSKMIDFLQKFANEFI